MKQALWQGMLMLGLSVLLTACTSSNHRYYVADNTKAAKVNVQLGSNYMQRGQYAVALEKLQKALRQDPTLPSAHNTVALLYQQLAENGKAEEHFNKAIQYDADYAEAHNNYGVFLCQQGAYLPAEQHFLKAIAQPLYRSKAFALENAGLCMQRIPDLDKAEHYLRQALERLPTLPKSLSQMAKISYRQKKYLQARAYIQQYQQVADWTADALFTGVKIESKLGDKDVIANYSLLLRSDFPESDEVRMLNQGLTNE